MAIHSAREPRQFRATLWAFFVLSAAIGATAPATATAANDPSFEAFLDDVAEEARDRGVGEQRIRQAFDGLTPNPRVIELDRRQPEHVLTTKQYVAQRITASVIEEGTMNLATHAAIFDDVERSSGVSRFVVAAIWGIESRYGRYTGNMPVIRSLATLAHDPRRSAFFRRHLIDALLISTLEDIPPDELLGSWAGALGAAQFMPSTWRNWARDGDGDGRRDLLNSTADVLMSIGQYLDAKGWRTGAPWGEELDRVPTFTPRGGTNLSCRALRAHSVAERTDQGLATTWENAGTAWRVYENFRTMLEYNCANSYSLAVLTLSDALRAAAGETP